MKYNRIIIFIFCSLLGLSSLAQTNNEPIIIEIDPLFDYPVAPEEIQSLTDKSNYLVQHFWDPYDFKSKQSVDQTALNEAFRVFSTPMRWSDREKSLEAVDKIISKIKNNPTQLLQFTKAAEENLYGPRAQFWADEVYLKFLSAYLNNKKISDSRKAKYLKQQKTLSSCLIGERAPEFSFEGVKGEKHNYFPMSTPTLIIFGNPDDTDWRLARIRMETNSTLTSAVDKGKINILFIIPQQVEGWQKTVSNYPANWKVGIGENLQDIIDMRVYPTIYVIGGDGKIVEKNVTLGDGINTILSLVN